MPLTAMKEFGSVWVYCLKNSLTPKNMNTFKLLNKTKHHAALKPK